MLGHPGHRVPESPAASEVELAEEAGVEGEHVERVVDEDVLVDLAHEVVVALGGGHQGADVVLLPD